MWYTLFQKGAHMLDEKRAIRLSVTNLDEKLKKKRIQAIQLYGNKYTREYIDLMALERGYEKLIAENEQGIENEN